MRKKASITVEAALLSPFLCLILCGLIMFTLELYRKVDNYTEQLINREEQEGSSLLIRLEAVTEDIY